ncbi:bric-a-brac 2-like 5 [Homarus americanus]|uniref:Bric-a-brac 2-like 5 n=1 Tax=Homarus americanus TaxID=6706 RepID=A0A8J5MV32_HOMAM|nr:bric-a-brac 2-like 5 [Homarus americanus]
MARYEWNCCCSAIGERGQCAGRSESECMLRPGRCACVSVGTRACASLQSGTLPVTLVITNVKIDCQLECPGLATTPGPASLWATSPDLTSPVSASTMASQQFCLRWNNYQSNLMQVFDQLLQTESFVDVTLSCEGQSIKAHRMVLSACSPYFQCLLSEAPCTHPVIILQGVKWPELKAVVEFMYKGEINICQEQLGSLLRVAESLKIRGLAEVDGDGAEPAVLTSPSVSPAARALSNTLEDSSPSSVLAAARKRRRYSGDDGSRPCTPMTPTSGPEAMETTTIDLSGPLIRSGMTATLPGSPLTSLAARLPGAMPPPAPMAPHLTHLPPLSPLLNMHSMPRPHAPDDFEIRPGIAEMIREEERVSNVTFDPLCARLRHWHLARRSPRGSPTYRHHYANCANLVCCRRWRDVEYLNIMFKTCMTR